MNIVTVKVSNSNDPECARLTLTRRFPVPDEDYSVDHLVMLCAKVEREHREVFPKGMRYTVPFTEIDIDTPGTFALRHESREEVAA